MSGKPRNTPMTKAEMIEAEKQKRSTSKISKAESDEIKDEAISKSVSNLLEEIRRSEHRPRINLDDTESVKAVTELYLETCVETSTYPAIKRLASALGHTARSLYQYMDRKPDTETGMFLAKIHDLFAENLSENALKGNANNITAIFLLKSLYNYQEKQTFEFVHNTVSEPPSIDEIALRANLLSDD